MIMALITMKKLLQQEKNEGRGVGAFNEAMVQGTYENVLHHIKVFNGVQPV